MKLTYLLLTGFLLILSSFSFAKTPITDKALFETQLLNCFEKDDIQQCLPPLIQKYYRRDFTDDEMKRVITVYKAWLGTDHVYTIHKIRNTKVAEFYDEKIYLIEDTTGSVMLMILGMRSINGPWYINNISFSSKEAEISKVLGINP